MKSQPASRLTFDVTCTSDEEQTDPAGRSLVKRCQESEPHFLVSLFRRSISRSQAKEEQMKTPPCHAKALLICPCSRASLSLLKAPAINFSNILSLIKMHECVLAVHHM